MRVLVIDVGGTHVKVLATGQDAPVSIDSGPEMSAAEMVAAVQAATAGWAYDVVSIGYPGPVRDGRPVAEPHNLAAGWVGFDYAAALGRPVRMVNDAAMQALGSYRGGRMLFLGLGTGLGSALVIDGVLQPLELAHLPYRKGRTFEEYVGAAGRARLGDRKWRKHVGRVVDRLRAAMQVDSVALGGGNARRLEALPAETTRVPNTNAFIGGMRLWDPAGPMRDAAPRDAAG